jgi:hypothetical protein
MLTGGLCTRPVEEPSRRANVSTSTTVVVPIVCTQLIRAAGSATRCAMLQVGRGGAGMKCWICYERH